MKKLRLADLDDVRDGHFLGKTLPGAFLNRGGLSYKKPNQRTHDVDCGCAECDGHGHHVHADECEVFVILQGKAVMEINGQPHPLVTGDIMVCEPGEDHHLIADADDPCVNLWLHAGAARHPDQKARSTMTGDDNG